MGNQALKYPIGLITSDEIIFAGGFGNKANETFYLYTLQVYWTMSPAYYEGSYNGSYHMLAEYQNRSLDIAYGGYNYGIRPVINLKADTKFSGSGSESDPYIVI